MILCDQIKQHGSFLLHGRIEVLPTESLINLTDGAFERIVFLMGKPLASAKLRLQLFNGLHGSLVGRMKPCFVGCLFHGQLLVIVLIQGIKGIGIVGNDLHQIERIIRSQCLLCLDRPAQDGYQPFQFRIALFRQGLIDDIALHQILFQYLVGPNAELCATLAFYTIAYRDNDIQGIKGNRLFYPINTQKMRVVSFFQFTFGKDIINVLSYSLFIPIKQSGHLVSREPYRIVF